MIDRRIPEHSSVVRHVGFTRILVNLEDGSAFSLRQGEIGLSINWLDFFHGLTKEEQPAQVRQVIHMNLGARAAFAELNVGETRRLVANLLFEIQFVLLPAPANERYPADPSHSETLGLPPPNATDMALLIGDMIAQCTLNLHPARAIA